MVTPPQPNHTEYVTVVDTEFVADPNVVLTMLRVKALNDSLNQSLLARRDTILFLSKTLTNLLKADSLDITATDTSSVALDGVTFKQRTEYSYAFKRFYFDYTDIVVPKSVLYEAKRTLLDDISLGA